MRVYKTAEIRNVTVVGHGASGKTSLVDALAFVAGTSKRHGSVKDGSEVPAARWSACGKAIRTAARTTEPVRRAMGVLPGST